MSTAIPENSAVACKPIAALFLLDDIDLPVDVEKLSIAWPSDIPLSEAEQAELLLVFQQEDGSYRIDKQRLNTLSLALYRKYGGIQVGDFTFDPSPDHSDAVLTVRLEKCSKVKLPWSPAPLLSTDNGGMFFLGGKRTGPSSILTLQAVKLNFFNINRFGVDWNPGSDTPPTSDLDTLLAGGLGIHAALEDKPEDKPENDTALPDWKIDGFASYGTRYRSGTIEAQKLRWQPDTALDAKIFLGLKSEYVDNREGVLENPEALALPATGTAVLHLGDEVTVQTQVEAGPRVASGNDGWVVDPMGTAIARVDWDHLFPVPPPLFVPSRRLLTPKQLIKWWQAPRFGLMAGGSARFGVNPVPSYRNLVWEGPDWAAADTLFLMQGYAGPYLKKGPFTLGLGLAASTASFVFTPSENEDDPWGSYCPTVGLGVFVKWNTLFISIGRGICLEEGPQYGRRLGTFQSLSY